MITLGRERAIAYLVAMGVWVAGWLAVVLSSIGVHAPAPAAAVAVLLTCLFGASGCIGVIAWKVVHEGAGRTTSPIRAGAGDDLRLFVMSGVLWTLLLHGAGLPAAFRAVDSNR